MNARVCYKTHSIHCVPHSISSSVEWCNSVIPFIARMFTILGYWVTVACFYAVSNDVAICIASSCIKCDRNLYFRERICAYLNCAVNAHLERNDKINIFAYVWVTSWPTCKGISICVGWKQYISKSFLPA